jgi:outer membrane protein OmpA-like peptidoglycan-associated protein
LKKKPVWGISGTVYNAETKSPVEKVKVTIKNRLSAEETTYETSEEGSFRIKLKKNSDYYLHFNKEGFESIRREYYTRGREHGWVNLNDLMDINLKPVKEEEYTYLKGKIKDKSSEEGIKAKLQLIDNDKNKIVATYLSDKNGEYKIRLPEVKKYGVEITAKDYLYFAEQIDFSKMNVQNDIIQKEFALEKIEVGKKVVIENIFFETGKSKLKPESYKSLDKVLKLLKNNMDLKLEIAGHTDNVGSYMANKKLSKNRAKSVVDYLVGHGIKQSRLEYEGYSFTKPIATNKTSAGRQKNRRVEFEILEK